MKQLKDTQYSFKDGLFMQTIAEELIVEIENKKLKMVKIARKNGMKSSELVNCSQELDKLILKFQRVSSLLVKRKREHFYCRP